MRSAAPRTLPAILFDMDGTLVDSIELILQSAVFAFDGREGPRPTRAEWQALIGTSLDSILARWTTGPDDKAFILTRYRDFQVRNHDRLVRLYDGASDLLRLLRARGHPMAVVSSKNERGIRRSMDYFGLTSLFDVLVGIESTTYHKPHPEPVLFALARLGVAAGDAVFIGDSPHDVESAKGAGVRVLAVTWGAYTREELAPAGPDGWIESMADLNHALGGVG